MTEFLKKRTRKSPKQVYDDIDIAVLIELNKQPPATYREIGDVIGRSHMTVRQRVMWLYESGYVTRAPGMKKGDARSIILTEKGKSLIDV